MGWLIRGRFGGGADLPAEGLEWVLEECALGPREEDEERGPNEREDEEDEEREDEEREDEDDERELEE